MIPEKEKIEYAASILTGARNGVAFTGAGISTPSGIPDFRSPESGLWQDADPIQVASIYGFRQNPQGFYEWIYPLAKLTVNAKPNPAHEALAQLEQVGSITSVITQNIDGLHTKAGSQHVFELHGHMRSATCIQCFVSHNGHALLDQFLRQPSVPICEHCGGVIKPDVILFGEQLPVTELLGAKNAARKADVMLIVGSSLEVAPASDLPIIAVRNGARLIIVNLQPTPADNLAEVVIHADAAEVLPQIVYQMEAQA